MADGCLSWAEVKHWGLCSGLGSFGEPQCSYSTHQERKLRLRGGRSLKAAQQARGHTGNELCFPEPGSARTRTWSRSGRQGLRGATSREQGCLSLPAALWSKPALLSQPCQAGAVSLGWQQAAGEQSPAVGELSWLRTAELDGAPASWGHPGSSRSGGDSS